MILVYLTLLALVTGFILLLAPLLIEQTKAIIAALPTDYQSLHATLASSPSALIRRLALHMPAAAALSLPEGATGG